MRGARSGGGWSLIGIGAGVCWLTAARAAGPMSAAAVGAIGLVLGAGGVAQLLFPADRRTTELPAFFGLVGVVLALPFAFAVGFPAALMLGATALAASFAAGRRALALEAVCDGVPIPVASSALAAKVALDEALLGYELVNGGRFAADGDRERVVDELARCRRLFAERGFLERPETYHVAPPDLAAPTLRPARIAGHAIEVLRFESGYAPHDGEPGRERWLAQEKSRTAWAYVSRRGGPGRPWLVCTNGYRMGFAAIDVRLFERFFARLGLNVLIPVLPLHGPRRGGFHSGSGFLGLDVIDTLHAEAQAVWDMRRLLSWIRTQEPSAVGAIGLSLGGYTTALFASVVDGLACAIPGIPLADIPRMLGRHAQPRMLRRAIEAGYSLDRAGEVLRVVSPLALRPRVPKSGRLLFGAVADRLVTPDQVRDLWRHWEEPEIVWYQGGHVSFRDERIVWAAIDRKLSDVGLVPGGQRS